MTFTLARRCLVIAALGIAPLLPLTTSCSEDTLPLKGQLMLVITTNMAPPKDFDTLHVRIVEDGSAVPVHDVDYALGGSQPVKLPATLGVVVGSDPNRELQVTVEARRGGLVRVSRSAAVRPPRDRIAALPLPIDGLCIDTACPSDANGKPQTCVAGSCQSAEIATEALQSFSLTEVFGGGTGQGDGNCFDTLACFTNGKASVVRATDCSIDRETTSGFGLNIAVVRPPQSDGICGSNACLLPLDRDPFTGPIVTGWREAGDRALLPKAVCDRSLPIMITTSCETKIAPTCGPWSATGRARDLGDASIPFDAAGLSVGDGGLSPQPQAIRFLDEDLRQDFVAGTVTIVRATQETDVAGYNLYWGDGSTKKLDRIAALPKTGEDVTHVLSGAVLPGATYLLAFSTTAAGEELAPGVSIGPIDNYPRSEAISANAVDMPKPSILVDPKTDNLLVYGFDQNPARNNAALLRCKVDGSNCTYIDISAGEPAGTGVWELGAAIDPSAQKLLVVSDQGGGGLAPKLLRCATDGTSCTATPLSVPPLSTGCIRIPVFVDEVNQKLLAVVTLGSSAQTALVRCALDGQGCTTTPFAPNTNSCPAAVISPTDAKLLMVQSALSHAGPALFRCELDGTNCVETNITAGKTAPATAMSVAIDTENQKLVTVSYETNGDTLYFYRCNLDGSGCASSNLGVKDANFGGPADPFVVIDAPHRRLFAFAFSGSASRGLYTRCNLDGTDCTNTGTSPSGAFGGRKPGAILYGGKLFNVSPAFNAAGAVSLTTFFAY